MVGASDDITLAKGKNEGGQVLPFGMAAVPTGMDLQRQRLGVFVRQPGEHYRF